MAIDRRTFIAAAARDDRLVRSLSVGFAGQIQFDLASNLQPASDWANHLRGIAACLLSDEYDLCGADLLIESNIPLGAGLSSSAALEVVAGFALLKLAHQPVDLVDLALAGQRAEQEFTGTQCGVMDQYVSCLGVQNHALLVDCRSLEYRAIPMALNGVRVVVCNSMVKHDLTAGEYNNRRAACEEGVRILAKHLPNIQALRDVEIEEFDAYAASRGAWRAHDRRGIWRMHRQSGRDR
jgi:galactokinase